MTDLQDLFSTARRLQQTGQAAQAEQLYRQILQTNPDHGTAHFNLGALLHQKGESVGAKHHYEQTIRLQPEFVPAHNNLGNLLLNLGDMPGAIASYREALRLNPDSPEVLTNYGKLLHDHQQWHEALACYDRGLRVKPDFPALLCNRAILYAQLNMVPQAIADYESAIRLEPSNPAPYVNLGLLCNDIGRSDEALECGHKLLGLGIDSTLARLMVANALRGQGRVGEAIDWFRRSLELSSESAHHSDLLYVLNFDPDCDRPTIYAEHLAWAKKHAEPLTALAQPHSNDRTADRRLRIGYVSPHFRDHAVSFFTEPLLAAHDHEQFEVFCYCDYRAADVVTTRLQATADHWRMVSGMSDEQVAALVRDDRIDILVDLTGHIGGNRLLVFARKPAPIQVTYIGYQNTTGMSAMDYRLTDERADPPGLTDPFYTERLVRLPKSFFCYRPDEAFPPITPLPALAAHHVTFGSFNLFAKVTSHVIDAWLDILARVPGSRLMVLANRGGYAQQQFHQGAQARGIEPERIEMCERLPRPDYLRRMQQVDIALDPFPFNGHTTTCDAIWTGVPVVMLEGQTYAARFGGSVLANVGLAHLIAQTRAQYIEIAVRLASDLAGLAQLRRELRPRMASSALLDFNAFARNVERAYRQMWIDWCQTRG
jgi:protein O-GlcNAc transferase